MNRYTLEEQLVVVAFVAITVGLVMTPILGVWSWVVLVLGAWLTWQCVAETKWQLGE